MKKVSILTPCYNGEKYLDVYFNSLLSQTVTDCELIFMDDGSTDHTRDKFNLYKPLLERKGFDVKYYYHKNMGLGFTIAEGIKYVTGQYLVWPDCDDILFDNFIEEKLRFLESNINYGVVRSEGIIVDENALDVRIRYVSKKNPQRNKSNLFEEYLLGDGENAWLMPLSFMIRMSAFDEVNPDRYIYGTRYGQDWQMLLPLLYRYPCGYIDVPLFKYVLRKGSLSNTNNNQFEHQLSKQINYEEIIKRTLTVIRMDDKKKWEERVHQRYLTFFMDICFMHMKKNEMKKYYNEYRKLFGPDMKYMIKCVLCKSQVFHWILDKKNDIN